jgi:hypothetical protein
MTGPSQDEEDSYVKCPSDVVEDLREKLRWQKQESDSLGVSCSFGLLKRCLEEIERLRSLAGAVSPGQSVADIKEHLRTLKKTSQMGHERQPQADRPDSVNGLRNQKIEKVAEALMAISIDLPGAGGLRGFLKLSPALAREMAREAIRVMAVKYETHKNPAFRRLVTAPESQASRDPNGC